MPIMFKPRVRCMNSVARSNRSQVWEERPLRGQPAKNCFNRRVKADKGIFAGFIFPEEGGGVYVFPSGETPLPPQERMSFTKPYQRCAASREAPYRLSRDTSLSEERFPE